MPKPEKSTSQKTRPYRPTPGVAMPRTQQDDDLGGPAGNDSPLAVHSEHSSYREKLLEHLFIGEVLKELWRRNVTDAEILRPEVDCGGYDLVISCNHTIRHVQLKASHKRAKTAKQTVNLRCTRDLLLPRLLSGVINLNLTTR